MAGVIFAGSLRCRLDPRLDLHAHAPAAPRHLRHVAVTHPHPFRQGPACSCPEHGHAPGCSCSPRSQHLPGGRQPSPRGPLPTPTWPFRASSGSTACDPWKSLTGSPKTHPSSPQAPHRESAPPRGSREFGLSGRRFHRPSPQSPMLPSSSFRLPLSLCCL